METSVKILVFFILFLNEFLYAQQNSWVADPKIIEAKSQGRDFNYQEEKVPEYALPDLLTSVDGIEIKNKEQWNSFRRGEIYDILEKNLFGKIIGKPDSIQFELVALNPDTLTHQAKNKTVNITVFKDTKKLLIKLWVFIPKNTEKPAPAFLLINHRGESGVFPSDEIKTDFWPVEEIIKRGYATASFSSLDLDPDSNEDKGFRNGIHGILEPEGDRPDYAWGTLAAWAWGASRVMDYLVTDNDIAPDKIAVVGHSRGGKTALWAGGSDERFAITISNMSGCGGAAISRRQYGETVGRINTRFPNWFCNNYKQYNGNENNMPFDQHFLISLIAPRAVYVASANEDLWADPRGEFLSLKESQKVYQLFNKKGLPQQNMPSLDSPVFGDCMGYHIQSGQHNLTLYNWLQFMDFADRYFNYGNF